MASHDDSSDSDGETEPAKCFHKRLSTNKQITTAKCVKEGYLLKQGHSFQRWKKRYFKLKSRKLFYFKDSKSPIFNEIDLIDTIIAECSMKNINHSFQVITPFRNLILCTESRREMEEWMSAIRAAAANEFYDPKLEQNEFNCDHHNWCAFPHVRPMYCNVCREALSGVSRSGVTLRGLSCEVCKFKTHKHCAAKVSTSCKWMTMSSVGEDIIEEEDGTIRMPHQWMFGNLPVNAKCCICDKTCGSIRRLQDWWCLWCHCTVHASCKNALPKECSLGQCRISILPPTAITNLDSDGFWRATKPPGTSPLLVFINSKSGDNQGVKMLRKFKQLLNPAQVFDLINGGPKMGLRLFQNFESFRVLVCGGDGSIGWVLSEIDKLGLHKQCQIGVLPLGTGNDLARVLGWGSTFDDDSQLPNILEQLEHAQIKMLDRWSVYCYQSSLLKQQRLSAQFDLIAVNDLVANHLSRILHSESHNVVISSAMFLCGIVKELVDKLANAKISEESGDDSIAGKCMVLNEKLSALLNTLDKEASSSTSDLMIGSEEKSVQGAEDDEANQRALNKPNGGEETVVTQEALSRVQFETSPKQKHRKPTTFRPREQLMSRANSLKKAVRQIIEHTERAVDEQNAQTLEFEQVEAFRGKTAGMEAVDCREPEIRVSSVDSEPLARSTASSPELVGCNLSVIDECEVGPIASSMVSSQSVMSALAVPNLQPLCLSDVESSACSTPRLLTPEPWTPEGSQSPLPRRRGVKGESSVTLSLASRSESKTVGSRRISSLSMFKRAPSLTTLYSERSPTKESVSFPLLNVSLLQTLPNPGGSSGAASGSGFVSKMLLASADAVCAAVSPFTESEEILLDDYEEKCVMNNYFGIGLDAKIALEFHNKREEHPEKCRSRTKNMMWYGVLGGREIYHRTFKNLEQRVRLECDGQLIPLPNLQGVAVLNIPSYMGGTNFWGGTKEDEHFISTSFDDNILEVVAVFGSIQLGISRVLNIQRHRIAQCRTVKITIIGNEGVPVQVDGEAWIQPPGFIYIAHKNRAQMLTRDKVFEEALKTWTEKQKVTERPISPKQHILSNEESLILQSFISATEALIKSVKVASICQDEVEQDLLYLANQASGFLDRLNLQEELNKPAKRTQVSDLVSSVRTLYNETKLLMSDKACVLQLRSDAVSDIPAALSLMEVVMEKVYEIGGLPHFQTIKEEASTLHQMRTKDKNTFRKRFMKSGKEKSKETRHRNVSQWSVEEVSRWLHSLDLDEYRGVFSAHDIQGRELITLGRTDLKELGISKVGHLRRILEAINDLRKDKVASSPSFSPDKGNQVI